MKKDFLCYFYEFDSETCRCIDILRNEKHCKRIFVRFDGTMWRVKGSV